MASYKPKLLEKKYHNWVKAGLAVLFTKEGIEPFVCDEIQQFQLECLDDICYNNGLMSGTTCFNCCTENVVACPTRGICNIKQGQCRYHKDSTTQYNFSGCPSKICHNLKDKIQRFHRFNSPSFKNTQANSWCSNPWEVAKCFMPPDGYKDVTSAAETDFNGINSVVINHKGFQSKVHDDLSDKENNIFAQARVIARMVRHSSSLEVDDTSLNQYFTELQLILSDSGYLNTNAHAQTAKQKLRQLQNDTLVIGKEEVRKVLDDVAKVVQNTIRTAIHEQEREAEKKKLDLLNTSLTSIDALKKQEKVSLTELNNALSSALHQLKEKTEESIKAFETKTYEGVGQIKHETHDSIKTLETKTDESVEQIKHETHDSIKTLETKTDEGVGQIKYDTHDSIKTLESKTDEGVGKINHDTQESIKSLETETDEGVGKIKYETRESIKTLETKMDEGVEKIQEEAKTSKRRVEDETRKTMKRLKTFAEKKQKDLTETVKTATVCNSRKQKEIYNNLQGDLIQHYREQYNTLPITPLLDGIIDVPLLEMYVPPFPMIAVETDNMKFISRPAREEPKIEGFLGKETKKAKVNCKTLSDVFCKNQKSCKSIYITAEPGFGKSSFVKWLILTWCQARKPLSEFKEFISDKDLQQMRKFEFVFLVLLRDTQPEEIHVDKMLANHLTSLLGRQSLYTVADVENILSTRKCLIVLDGLDEWSSTNDPSALPIRAARDTCSYITTSRPWKMATVSVRSSHIDQHIQIKDLQSICTDQILPKLLNIFRKNKCLRSDYLLVTERYYMNFHRRKLSTEERRFLEMLTEKKIKQFAASPVMLMQILYLWNFDKTVGNSQCQIYSNIVDALLARAVEKGTVPKLLSYENVLPSKISYFDSEAYNCDTYYKLLHDLGNVAFQTLFSDQKESSLVFKKKDLKQYVQTGNNDEFLDTAVKVGLLSQEMHMTPRRKEYSYSFYHKTIQEYFAALYIQSVPGDQHVREKIMTRCNTVSSILEMGTVFMFLSGFNPQIACELLQSLQSTINDGPEIKEYRNRYFSSLEYSLPMNVQNMIVNCVEECRRNGHELLVSKRNKNAIQFPLCDIVINHDFSEFCLLDMEYIIKCNGSKIKSLLMKYYSNRASTDLTESLTYSDVECLEYLYVFCCKKLPPLLSSLDRLVHLKIIGLSDIDLGEGHVLGPDMKHIESVQLFDVSITSRALHVLVDTVLTCEHSVTGTLFSVTVNDRTIVKQEKTVKHDISTLPTFRGGRSNHGWKTFLYQHVTITTRTLQEFLYTVEKCQHPVKVMLSDLTVLEPNIKHASGNDNEKLDMNDEFDEEVYDEEETYDDVEVSYDEEGYQIVNEYIRSSSSFSVKCDSGRDITFVTKYKPENSDNDTSGESK